MVSRRCGIDLRAEIIRLSIKVIGKNNQRVRRTWYSGDFVASSSSTQDSTLFESIRLRTTAVITWLIVGNSVCCTCQVTCKSSKMLPALTDSISQTGAVQKVERDMFCWQWLICFHTSLENWETVICILECLESNLEHNWCNQVSYPRFRIDNTLSNCSTNHFYTPNPEVKSFVLKRIILKRWPTLRLYL